METQVQTYRTTTAASTGTPGGVFLWFNNLALKYEESRYGAMALLMTLQSCVGSIACFYILSTDANIIMLTTGVIVTMMINALFISQSPAKWCVGGFIISMIVNLVLILLNFFI